MPSYSPGRPPNLVDSIHLLNGTIQYLGVLTSTGAGVNNLTTAAQFNQVATGPGLMGTLAGRCLAVQATAAGFFLPATTNVITIANQTTIPPAANTIPGLSILASDVKVFFMSSAHGWLQWICTTGSLLVWEVI